MDIVPLIRQNSGCDYWRMTLPFQQMGTDFHKLNTETVANLLKGCKIITFNRIPAFSLDTLLVLRNHYKFKIVVDIDDYWELPTNSIFYKTWKEKNTSQKIREAIMNSDFVFASTSRLASKVKELNSQVEVVPNAIPFGVDQFNDEHEDSEVPRVMYAGGVSHFWDLHHIKGLFELVARKGLNFQMQLAGYTEANESSRKYWI